MSKFHRRQLERQFPPRTIVETTDTFCEYRSDKSLAVGRTLLTTGVIETYQWRKGSSVEIALGVEVLVGVDTMVLPPSILRLVPTQREGESL